MWRLGGSQLATNRHNALGFERLVTPTIRITVCSGPCFGPMLLLSRIAAILLEAAASARLESIAMTLVWPRPVAIFGGYSTSIRFTRNDNGERDRHLGTGGAKGIMDSHAKPRALS